MKKLIYLLTVLTLFACHAQKETSRQQKTRATADCKTILPLNEEANPGQSDPYQLDSLAVNNHCLEVFVSYSGGCGEAEFDLYATNKVMQSMPPQAVLLLNFKDEDPCRAIVRDTLYFDLSNFNELAKSGGIWLHLKDSDKRVLYSF